VISEDWAGARAAVDDIVAGESDPPTGEIYSFLRLLVQYQCRAGQLDEATKTAEDTRFDLRDSLLQGKAEHCAAAKDWAQALRLAMDIKDLYSRTSTIVHIAEKKHDAGRKEEARRTLDGARKGVEGLDGFSKNQALTWLAQAYRRIGDRQTALQLAESITNTSPKYPAREQALSLLHAELGDIATALDFARKVREIQPDSEYCFRRVAEIQAKGKKFKDAWRTVEEMKEGYFRTQATLAIAEEQHRAGMTEDAAESFRVAVRTAENTPAPPTTFKFWPFEHASIFRQIAKTQAELGEVAAAHTWIRRQFSPKTQAYALIGAAEGLHARLEAARMKR
jgi:tetratricopeptide (TPR) repeat protein